MQNPTYAEHALKIAKPSSLIKDCFFAFMIGGFICALGQAFLSLYRSFGVPEETAALLTPVSLIFLSCLFTGVGWYDKIAGFAGAGTLVPITGFANAMSSPAIDNRAEGLVLGLGAKIFIICGPVLLYGTVFSVALAVLAYILRFFGIDLTEVV